MDCDRGQPQRSNWSGCVITTEGVYLNAGKGSAGSTTSQYLEFSIPYCASHAAPHMGMHRQADEACPRAVHKTGTYRSLRFF